MLLSSSLMMVLAFAQPGDALSACRDIADPAARLACYDAAAAAPEGAPAPIAEPAPMAAKPAPAPMAETAAPVAAPAAEPAARFGLRPERVAPAEAMTVTAAVERVEFGRAKPTLIFLANGQVWQQIGANSEPLPYAAVHRPQTATVREAALGSFRMRLEPVGETIRVKRIK